MSINKTWWKPIAHLAAHTLVGTIIFIIFGLVAVGLALLIQYLESMQIPVFTLQVLDFVEHVILITYMVLYLSYLGIAGLGALKEMME